MLDNAIAGLKKYAATHPEVKILRNQLKELKNKQYVSSVELSKSSIDALRLSLRDLLLRSEEEKDLFEAIVKSLLALAQLAPLNAECPITLDAIAKENQVVISTGHQFDINALLHWNRTRPVRENEVRRALINPITNLPFLQYDEDHITRQVGMSKQNKKLSRKELSFFETMQAAFAFPLKLSPFMQSTFTKR